MNSTKSLSEKVLCFGIAFHLFLLVNTMLFFSPQSKAQCYSTPAYCIPTFANVNSYNIGIQNVTLLTNNSGGVSINNTSIATGNAPNYYNYTSQVVKALPGDTFSATNCSVKNGAGNTTGIRIYIDYNNDGVFSTSAPELVWTSPTTTANAIVPVSFIVPSTITPGVYRIRLQGDLGGQAANPCASQYGEDEDYTLLVPSPTIDVMSSLFTSPSFFIAGNNTIGFSFSNISSVTLTSINIGYQLDANTPVTQSLTGLSVAPGATYTATFSTLLNIPTTGTFNLKTWQTNPNSAGSVSPVNDTICRNVITYCASALSGAYTIDPAGSGSTNFTRFGAADSSLMACGISGPVVFNVAAGTYNEQIYLSNITGASATNTITFDGGTGNTSTRIITYNGVGGAPYTVRLNGANYVTYKNLTIQGTNTTNAWVVHFLNGTNNRVNNCVIEITGAGATAGTSNLCPVVVNGSATTISTVTTLANNITIDSCMLNAGYYNIYCAMSTSANTLNVIANNLNNAYQYAYYSVNTYSPRIRANSFSLRTTNASNYGIYLQSCNNSGSDYYEISRNKIINAGMYGIYLSSNSNNGSATNQVINNMIGGGFRYTSGAAGIYLTSCTKTNVYHNSVNLDIAGTSGTSAALYINAGSVNDIRNNHFYVSSSTATNTFALWLSAASVVSYLDFNNYYNRSSSTLLNIGGNNFTNANFRASLPNGGGQFSINLDPQFISNTNLHTTNGCNRGTNLSVALDFDGDARTTSPNIGADELTTLPTNDIGVLKINSPGFPLSTGAQYVNLTLKNYGGNTVYTADVYYSVNGGTATMQGWTGTLAPCDSVNFSFAVPYTFTTGVSNLKTYTAMPNGSTDANANNDTSQFTISPAMSGTYTIDPAGSGATNFPRFGAADTALMYGGISGPVLFNVAVGTYNEQILIPSGIAGSPINSITFQSATGVASGVILSFNATTLANNYTVRLSGINNVKFKNMTISATNASYGTALSIINNASSDSFYNVVFNSVVTTSNTNNLAVIYCPSPTISNFIYFDTCRVNNGAYGSYFTSNSNSTLGTTSQNVGFNNCDFVNQYSYGMYHQYLDGFKLTRNRITTNSTSTNYYGMYNYWIMILSDLGKPVVTGNKISGAVGGYGMYNYYVGVNSTITANRKPLYANNMIQIGSGSFSTYGLYDAYSYSADFINNSVNNGCTQTTNTSAAAWFVSSNNSLSTIQNNIFASYNGAPAIRLDNASTYPTCNYNDLYTTGTNLGYVSGTAYTTLAAWRTATSRDANSVNVVPNYVSTSDLHISTATNVLTVVANPLVQNDFDNIARCGFTDIGADHHPGNNNIGVSSILFPYGSVAAAGARDIKVYIRNYGSNDITSANVRYTDFTTTKSIAWTGLLNPCDSVLVTFTGSNQYTFSGAWSLKYYTDSPNAVVDSDKSNDTLQSSGCIGLAGTYTIDPSGSGSTNYTSFSSALAAMQGCGIGAPVVFYVASGTYNEQLNIPNINGTSAVNTITFDGGTGNASTRILTYATTNSLQHVVRFNNCKYINFQNITVRSTGTTDAWVAHFLDGNNNRVSNCVIEITGTGATSTNSNIAPVVVNGSATSMSTLSSSSNNNTVDSCTLNAGYYSVYANINSSPNTLNIVANTLNNAYQYGVYGINTFSLRLRLNTIILRTSITSNQAVYLQSLNNSGTDYFEVSKNKVLSPGSYGFYLNSCNNNGSAYNQIYNNMIGGGFRSTNSIYGMYLTSCSRTQIYNNSINIDIATTSGTNSALYITNGGTNDVRNNILTVTSPTASGAYPLYINPATAVNACDNNNYYNRSSTTLLSIAGINYTASNFKSSYPSGGGMNSVNSNPGFVSSLDLHISDACMRGVVLANVTTDIDEQTRSNPPNIGADEVSGINNDAGTISIAPFTIGLQNVYVKIKNFGTNNLTSATVSYSVNGGTPKIVSWTGTLVSCDTITIVFSGTNQFNFALGTSYTIVAYTSNPNATTDPKTSNDTIVLGPSCSYFSGNFTINPTGSGANNFTSFASAAAALNCGGVNGPVVFKVAAGTYNEQFKLTNIAGASATNTITFDGDTAASRIITFAPTSNIEHHTIRLNGAQYVSIRNLTIQTTGASYGTCVHVMGSSNYSKIKNCNLIVSGSGATSTSNYYIPILVNNYNDIYNMMGGGTQVSYLEVDSNHLVGGYYGILHYGFTSTPYSNNFSYRQNIIDSSYYYGAYFYYTDGILFNNNVINMRISGSVNSQGFYATNCYAQGSNIHIISGNKIINAGQYGMYLYFVYNGTSTYRSRLANNMVGGGFRNSSAIGIYSNYCYYWDVWNNSANLDYPVTSSAGAAMQQSNGQQLDIRNNILVYSSATGAGVPFNASAVSFITALDYNDYYNNASPNLIVLGASSYTSNNYINGGGFNLYSKNQNPGFTSPVDLHIASGCLRGIQISAITTDLFGTTRANPPSMGAHEYTGSVNNDIGVSFIIAPSVPFTAGTQDVKVRISNFGANTITSATVNYSVNGGAIKTFSWSGSLAPCDTTSVTFTGTNQFNFVLGGAYTIKAYSQQPNGAADANRNNDTLVTTLCPAFSGAYTIDPAGSGSSNFATFTAAVNAINCGGVNGPVSFSVASGTYNEQITLNPISGASATNTVTFKSVTNNASNVTLSYNSTSAADNFIVIFNGCSYVRFANITLSPLGVNYGNALVITNSSNYNTVDSCIFNGLSTSSATTNLALIYSNNTKDNYNTISNCTLINASMGIYWASNSSSYATGNQILKNIFNNQYYSGIYTSYHDYLRIKQNEINASTGYTNYSGIYAQYSFNTTGSSQITRNKIIATIGGGYGIYNYYPNMGGNSTNRFLVANNMIQINTTSANTSYGMMDYYSYYIDVMHNTINISAQPTGTSYAFYNNYFFSTTCFVQNNVFVNSTVGAGATSYAVAEYLSSAGTWNNNNYYSTGTNLGQWNNVSRATLAAWRTASSQDAATYNRLPLFASSSDLHFYNLPCLNNTGANVLTKVADDYDGNSRTATPDIGAAEFTPYSLDASAIAVRAPSGALNIGTPYNVVVTISNNGTSVISSVVVGYRLNGGTPVTQTLSSLTLNPCDTLQVTFNSTSGQGSTDQRYYALSGLVAFKAYTATPNSSTDLNMSNDTTSTNFCTPFSGTFTINASLPVSSTNFQSFTSAKNALTGCGGITGPVVFNVAAGTYNEQIDLTAITGVSATNTVTFDGGTGNASTCILNYSSAASNSLHTLRINNAQFINIRNITIRGGSASYGWPLHIYGSSSNIKVKNCVIDFIGNGLNATNDNFDAIVVNNYAASASPTGGVWTGTNIEIDSNKILGGNSSMFVYGNSANPSIGLYFRNNRCDSAYNYGIYTYYVGQMKLNFNSISMRITGSISSMGIYLNNCVATATYYHEVSGNKIINCGQYGVYLSNSNGLATPRCQFFNNAIGGGFRNSNPVGIYSTSYSWDIFHNSVNLDNVATGTNSACLYFGNCCATGSTLLDVRNNIFAVTALGSSSLIDYYANAGSLNYHIISPSRMNYNIYYKAGMTASTQLFYLAGNYQTVANVIGNGGYNTNSLLMNPNFAGSKDLHISDGCNNGDSLGVTTDMDGNLRASYGDRGASEVQTSTNDIGVKAILQPSIPIAPGTQNIQVLVKNYGTNTVSNGTVKYSVNGGSPVILYFTDTILPCTTVTETFTGSLQYNFISGNTYTIKVYTESPNGSADNYNGNDTVVIGPVCIGLSGSYTINPGGSGTTNYTSFTNAINALLCSGVVGPTTFNVAAGTYNEQITIPAIPGASVSNPIIFDGGTGNASTRILVNNSTTQSTSHTIRLTNASFIQVNNLTIRSTGTNYAWPVHLFGICNNIKIKNNIIEITGIGATGTNSNFIPVVMSGSTTSATTNVQQDSIEIDSNIINGGYASIWDYNNNGTANRFRSNQLNLPYYYGIYVYYSSEVKIKNNTINMLPTGSINSQGMYLYNCNNTGTMMHEISANKIVDMGQYGIYSYVTSGTATNPAQMINNMIGGGFRNTTSHYGIAIDNGSYFSVWFNTVNSDTATTNANGALNISNASQINVRNNLLVVSAVGSQELPFYAATSGNVSVLNYNDYFINGSYSNLIFVGNYYNASTFIGGGGFNINSFSRDPLFTGKKNLHINKNCLNGIDIATVTTDIDGITRGTPPYVGAAEYTGGASNNIGVTNITAPASPLTQGYQDISVIVSNLGNNLVTSYNVSYSVNGGSPIIMALTDSLYPCDTSLVNFNGANQYNFLPGNAYSIKSFTSSPNGVNDSYHNDDTTIVGPICTSMNGNYTINPAGSGTTNFTSFNAAVSALQCSGVAGPVNILVSNGTYNEQVTIGSIAGVNDTMRVTFIGTSQSATILTYGATSSTASHTLKLNNSPYVNFDNMSILATGTTYGSAVHILGGSHYAKIKRCLIAISGTAATSTSNYFIPVMINNTNDITNPSVGTYVTNLEIDSNRIVAGYYSIYDYGRTSTPYSVNNKFRKNTIDSAYYYGTYFYYNDAIRYQNNTLNMRMNGSQNSIGLYMYFCYNSGTNYHDVSTNRIVSAGQYGVYNYYCSNNATNRGRFVNNMIGAGFRSPNSYGLYWQYSDYWNIYNNTVNLDYPTNSNTYAAANFYYYNTYNLDIKDNIFDYTATGGSGIPFYLSGTSNLNVFDYNKFYNSSAANLIYINGTTYTTTTFAGGGGYNTNSYLNISPYISSTNLHLSSSSVKGVAIATVGYDIDGEVRATPPDVGADEYYSAMDIGVLSIDSPTTATFCGRTRNIIVRLKNFGNQSVTQATINISVNGALMTSYTWFGTLAMGATSAPINAGTVPFVSGTYSVFANTSSPNGGVDVNTANDSAFVSFNVIPSVYPTITVNATATSICSGMSVTLIASITGGGTSPTYQWRKNGITVGTNDSFYSSSTLGNNDSIVCLLMSTANCATPSTVVSNATKMTVGTTLPPSVSINTPSTNICTGLSAVFTATPVNGGTPPHYQWKKNGVDVGTDTTVYVLSSPASNDSIRCVMTSTLSCASRPRDTSNYIKLTVVPYVTPSASITSTMTTLCFGVTDTFTATNVNGGTTPVYQWKKNNGVNIGTNNSTFVTSTLNNNDSIYLVLTSNALCASPTIVTSNKIGVTVNPSVLPTAVISANKSAICAADSVIFISSTTNGGSSPIKQWFKNGVMVSSGTDTFVGKSLSNNDTIYYKLTSNATCAVPSVINSNKKIITVNQYVTPIVFVTASNSNICYGSSVQFTAGSFNGGSLPHFTWKQNGITVGYDSVNFTTSSIFNGDSVYVIMNSNAVCANPATVVSNAVNMTVNNIGIPGVTIHSSTSSICAGTAVRFDLVSSNGGSAPHYQWMQNGTMVGTDTTVFTSSTFNNNDTVYVILTSNSPCSSQPTATSNKIILNVTQVSSSSVSISSSTNNVCAGTAITFTATSVNGGSTPQYQWRINGADVGPNTASFISASLKNNDTVYVLLTSSVACVIPAVATSNKVLMTIYPTVTPKISVSQTATNVCSGTTVTFMATDSNGGTPPHHYWYVNGVPRGSDSVNLTTQVGFGNVVKCILYSNAGCAAKNYDTAFSNIVVKAIPQKPSIIRTHDSLTSSFANSYQWYLNNNSISGATSKIFVLTQNGSYKVTIDSVGCTNTSDPITVNNVGIYEAGAIGSISIAPNPAKGNVLVNAQFESFDETVITVFDMAGKELLQTQKGKVNKLIDEEIALSEMRSGIYLVMIKHGDAVAIRKIVRVE